MGTRADFYVGRGEQAEWLGSYPWDGYPSGIFSHYPELFTEPLLETEWRAWATEFLTACAPKATTPDMGWPWPWPNSCLTDYAYALDDGVIYGASFGREWFKLDPLAENWGERSDEDGDYDQLPIVKKCVFPTMRDENSPKATLGPRSGLIVLGLPPEDIDGII